MGSYLKFVQHFFGNQNDAFFRTIKASRILNGIFANHRPSGITHPRSITQRLILQERPTQTPGNKTDESILQNELIRTLENRTDCTTTEPEIIQPPETREFMVMP